MKKVIQKSLVVLLAGVTMLTLPGYTREPSGFVNTSVYEYDPIQDETTQILDVQESGEEADVIVENETIDPDAEKVRINKNAQEIEISEDAEEAESLDMETPMVDQQGVDADTEEPSVTESEEIAHSNVNEIPLPEDQPIEAEIVGSDSLFEETLYQDQGTSEVEEGNGTSEEGEEGLGTSGGEQEGGNTSGEEEMGHNEEGALSSGAQGSEGEQYNGADGEGEYGQNEMGDISEEIEEVEEVDLNDPNRVVSVKVEGDLGSYIWGEAVDTFGITVTAVYGDGHEEEVTEYAVDMNYPALQYCGVDPGNYYSRVGTGWSVLVNPYEPGIYSATITYAGVSAEADYVLNLFYATLCVEYRGICSDPGSHETTWCIDKELCAQCQIALLHTDGLGSSMVGRTYCMPIFYDYVVEQTDIDCLGIYWADTSFFADCELLGFPSVASKESARYVGDYIYSCAGFIRCNKWIPDFNNAAWVLYTGYDRPVEEPEQTEESTETPEEIPEETPEETPSEEPSGEEQPNEDPSNEE